MKLNRILLTIFSALLPGMLMAQEVAIVETPSDARTVAMGGAGLAFSELSDNAFEDIVRLPMSQSMAGAGYSRVPWSQNLSSEIGMNALWAYWKPWKRHAFFIGARSMDFQSSERMNDEGYPVGKVEPSDITLELGYSVMVLEGLSLSATVRYLNSDPGAGSNSKSCAADLCAYYRRDIFRNEGSAFLKRAGISAQIRAFEMGRTIDYGSEKTSLKSGTIAGAALDVTVLQGLTAIAQADWQIAPKGLDGVSASFGAEYNFLDIASFEDIISLRGGYHLGNVSAGQWRYGTAGLGLNAKYGFLSCAFVLAGKDCPLRNSWLLSAKVKF